MALSWLLVYCVRHYAACFLAIDANKYPDSPLTSIKPVCRYIKSPQHSGVLNYAAQVLPYRQALCCCTFPSSSSFYYILESEALFYHIAVHVFMTALSRGRPMSRDPGSHKTLE